MEQTKCATDIKFPKKSCIMSPWLFNLLIDCVMREIRETAREIGVRMIDDRSRHEWITEWVIFADDTVLFGDDEKK